MAGKTLIEESTKLAAVGKIVSAGKNELADRRVMRIHVQFDAGPGTPIVSENLAFINGKWVEV